MGLFKKLFGKSNDDESSNTPENTEVLESNSKFEERNVNAEPESVKILPRVKVDYSHEIYAKDGGMSFTGNPMPKEWELTEDQKPIVKSLFSDLTLCFAVDKGDSYEILQNEMLKKNPNLTLDVLHQISINSLVQEIGDQIQMNGDPNHIVMVTAGGNFEAAIILIDNFWDQIHQILDGNAIVAIPAKDLLFICKEHNQEAVDKLKEITKGYFDKPDTEGLLSKALYLKEAGKSEMTISHVTF